MFEKLSEWRKIPAYRTLLWVLYSFGIAELAPILFLVVCSLQYENSFDTLKSYLGFSTMLLIGFGLLVAASGDRLLEKGISANGWFPIVAVSLFAVFSAVYLHRQYIFPSNQDNQAAPKPSDADFGLTSMLSLCAVACAGLIKYVDWFSAYSYNRKSI